MASTNHDIAADCFTDSGPTHMMSKNGASSSPMAIDWDKEEHRRCVAACLVKGAYVQENDCNRRRVNTKALAPAWWKSFGFCLVDVIKDDFDNDQFIFGAIYKYEPPAGVPHHPSAPAYVVAFRGTMLRHPKAQVDLWLDFKIIDNTLSESRRSKISRQTVHKLLDTNIAHATVGNVWLAGHSLGASMVLDVGRVMMAEEGFNLPTFLFNPPQVSLAPAIDVLLPIETVERGVYAASYILKAGLGKILKSHEERMERLFEGLSPWAPELYVHERDIICKGYIDYFGQRQHALELLHGIAEPATRLSYRDMFFSVLGKEKERPHLLPSARLWKNSSKGGDAHALQQWWKPDGDLSLSAMRYSYP